MSDMCNDNRFELVAKYKAELIESTNIDTSADEMAVIDNILFRMWQMGWLDRLEQPTVDAVPVEWIKAKIESLKSQGNEFASLSARIIQAMLNDYGADEERR